MVLLEALSRVLSKKRVRWYVFGAQAVNAYGVPRLTADVDVTIDVPSRARGSLFSALEQAGFEARVEDPEAFAKRTFVVPFVHTDSGLLLDLVIAGEGIERSFLARAVKIDIGGASVPMLSFEDLLITKVLAGRPKDIEDIRGALRLGRQIDLRYVRRVLTQLDEDLERNDLRPAFEELLAESKKHRPTH